MTRPGLLLVAAFLVTLSVGGAMGSHFRYGTVSWTMIGTRKITAKLDQAWRRDYSSFERDCGSWYWPKECKVNDRVETGRITFPNGSPSRMDVNLLITSINKAANYFVGTYSTSSTFSSNGPHQISFYTCCRIGGIKNRPAELATTSTVKFLDRPNSSPVTNAPPIIRFQQNRVNKFKIPISDPDLDLVKFSRVSIGNGAGNVNSLSVDHNSGQVVWNPLSSPLGYYTIVVRMHDYDKRYCKPPVTACSSRYILSDVMVDFFVEVIRNDGTRAPQVVVPPTPADGSTISVNAGQAFSQKVKIVDPDGDSFTIQPSWSVPGMKFDTVTGRGTLETYLRWNVPSNPQQINQACFMVRDSRNVESPLHCFTLKVGQITVSSVTNNDAGKYFVYPGDTAKVVGFNMGGGSNYKCRWRLGSGGVTDVTAKYVSITSMTCTVPNFQTRPGVYAVEVSKDGTGFTTDERTIEVRSLCPPSASNMCNKRGSCVNGKCVCNPPYSGTECESECGNGKVERGEDCDDGNRDDGDGCSSKCRRESGWTCNGIPSVCEKCGNGKKEGSEQCDDSNSANGDGCSSTCNVEPGFTCTGSPSVCQNCGNGVKEGTEECDDGNVVSSDGCSATCKSETGWTCAGTRPSVCQKCGNGVKEGSEQCDDGNTASNDGCSSACGIESGWTCSGAPAVCEKCGNGIREGSEECDDGNSADGDGCEAKCTLTPGWSCKDIASSPPQKCTNTPELCGNGNIDGTEKCDDGNKQSGDGCSFGDCNIEDGWVCTRPGGAADLCHKCGNAVVETGGSSTETCDDGNTTPGDGCDGSCHVESGFVCNTTVVPSVCQSCGNGINEGTETCDDGNKVSSDGCSDKCIVEPGYYCRGQPSVCTKCGDGVIGLGEGCDDGNVFNNDGCSAVCQVESPLWVCPEADRVDGVSVCHPIEKPPLTPGTIDDGGDFTSSTTSLKFGWSGFVDPVEFHYMIGTTYNSSDVVPLTKIDGTASRVFEHKGLSLAQGGTYFVTVRSKNSFSEFSWGNGDGVTVDTTPPVPGAVINSLGDDREFTTDTNTAGVNWYPFTDPESGVSEHSPIEYALGSTKGGDDIVPFTVHANSSSFASVTIPAGKTLVDGAAYHWTVRGRNNAGLKASGHANEFRIDLQPPSKKGVVIQDGTFQGADNSAAATWGTQFTDGGSGLDHVEWCLGLAKDGEPVNGVFDWTNVGTGQEASVTKEEPILMHKQRYVFTVRAFDGVGNTVETASDGFTVDLTPPTGGDAVVGFALDKPLETVFTRNELTLTWGAFKDEESFIDRYEVGFGTVNNDTDVIAFTEVTEGTTTLRFNDVPLENLAAFNGTHIYGIIRGYNGAGNYAEVATGKVLLSLTEEEGTDPGSRDSVKDDGEKSFLEGTAGKSILAAGATTAAVIGAAGVGFLMMKSLRKRRLAARTEAAREAKREAMKRNSSMAADNKEFEVNLEGEDAEMVGTTQDEVESANFT